MAQSLEMSDCEPAHTGSHKAWIQTRNVASLGYSVGISISEMSDGLAHGWSFDLDWSSYVSKDEKYGTMTFTTLLPYRCF